MPFTFTPVPGPFAPINPDIAERIFELSQDNDKDGFRNLGPGSDTFEYHGISLYNPHTHQYLTVYSGQNVNGGAGNDTIHSDGGNNTIYGGSGNDQLVTGAGSDKLYGGSGSDALFGGAGNDVLSGGSGDDFLHGDTMYLTAGGNDTLNGGSGNDTLYGSGGMDVLIGGSGADTFSFSAVTDSTVGQRDQIRDFSHAEGDHIYLPSFYLLENKTFTFSSGPSTAAGTIWITHVDATHDTVFVNTDGGAADMAIDVTLVTAGQHLTAADFHI